MKRTLPTYVTLLAMLLMVFAVSGCSDDDDGNPTNPTPGPVDQFETVAEAGDTYFDDYNTISGLGVNVPATSAFANYEDYYIVDTRAPQDFAVAHIKGSVNITIPNIMDNFDTFPTDQPILFVCYSGQGASYVASVVNVIGTETGHEALNLKFGVSAMLPPELIAASPWDYPTSDQYALDFVTTPAPDKPAPGDFPTVMTEAETKVEILLERAEASINAFVDGSAKMMPASIVDHNPDDLFVMNYFSTAAYADGHVPDSYQYTPKSDILSTGPLNTLPTDKPIAAYCYTGQTSAQLAAYLRMAGYDAKTVMYGVNAMCFSDTAINDVPWHGPEGVDYTPIFEGTGLAAK